MRLSQHFQGRLLHLPASLLLFLSEEVLKWQFPIFAAGEKLAQLVALLRGAFLSSDPQLSRR